MLVRFLIGIFALAVWLLLNWSFDTAHVLFGIVVGIVVSYMTGDVFVSCKKPRLLQHPVRILWFVYYIAVFIWECIKANLDGAYRVMHPDLPIHPGIVRVKTGLTSDIGLTLLANSLTLKPGTMTVDIDKAKGILYIHWVDVKTQDIQKASELIAQRFEKILLRIFE